MAKARTSGDNNAPSLMGEFRAIFKANPKLLKTRSNDQVADLWLENHPEHAELPPKAKSSMANIKSVLRQKKRKKGRKKAEEANGATEPSAAVNTKISGLESLENHIDDCMTLAKNLSRDKLDGVIKALRKARNQVVWMLGA